MADHFEMDGIALQHRFSARILSADFERRFQHRFQRRATLILHTNRPGCPLRGPSVHSKERTSERTSLVYLSESRVLGGQISLGEDNAPSPSHSMPISIPPDRPIRACPACLSPSICLSVCPRTHCALRIPIWAAGPGLAFSEAGVPSHSAAGIRRNCSFRRPSETFLEYFVTRGLRFAGPLPPSWGRHI